jgi:hypothetical protein
MNREREIVSPSVEPRRPFGLTETGKELLSRQIGLTLSERYVIVS